MKTSLQSRAQTFVQMSLRSALIAGIVVSASALAAASSGCSGARVYSEAAPNVPFRAYKSFALMEEQHRFPKQGLRSADIAEAKIEQALETEMLKRGYTADERDPDLLVRYSIATDTDTKLVSEPVYRSRPVVASVGVWRPRYYVARTPVRVGTVTRSVKQKEGILTIEVIDRSTNKVIWQGWSEEPIQNRADFAASLADNVRDIFGAYPVAAR